MSTATPTSPPSASASPADADVSQSADLGAAPPEGEPRAASDPRDLEAWATVRRATGWAVGVGCVPVPVLDILGITAIQLDLVRQLAAIYAVPYSKTAVKNVLGGIVGGAGTVVSAGALVSAAKLLPVVGGLAATLAMPSAAGATTYAIGRIFMMHFAAGGTLLDLRVDDMRAAFRREFEQAESDEAHRSRA